MHADQKHDKGTQCQMSSSWVHSCAEVAPAPACCSQSLLPTEHMPEARLPASTGTGRTGFIPVPPNNYPFYGPEEQYTPVMQADGGQLSGV